ncbi:MAG: hypothetical protein HY720_09040 [Planctomycetes bacterium]|nr:hypothetical protein [Planctomycetota bacterium]
MPRPSTLSRGALYLSAGILAACGIALFMRADDSSETRATVPFQKGVCLTDFDGSYDDAGLGETIERLRADGVEWVEVIGYGYMPDVSRPEIRFGDLSSSQAAAIRRLHDAGLRVLLMPQLWSHQFYEDPPRWGADIAMSSDEDWGTWFSRYREFLLHCARLAAEAKVEILSVGLEYVSATRQEARWRELVRDVRAAYPGPLTYGAHWEEEAHRIGFWDALDLVGVNLYYPLAGGGVERAVRELSALHEKTGKPILLTEAGLPSVASATEKPWAAPVKGASADEAEQALGYETVLSAFWEREWLAGIYFWNWPLGQDEDALGFSPKDKAAEEVLRRWFSSGPGRGPALPGRE